MHLKKWITVLGLFLTCIAHGQILKVDKSHLAKDSTNYLTGTADLRFQLNNLASTLQQQNSLLSIHSLLDLVYITQNHALITINEFQYFKAGDGPVLNNGSAHFRINWSRNTFLSPETFVQIQYDESRQMNLRFLYGAGTRFNIIKGDNSLHAGLGVFRENEIWENRKGNELNVSFNKLNSYLGGEVNINDHVELNSIVYFQTAYDNSIGHWRNRLNGSIELKDRITKNFQLKLALSGSFDDKPIIEITRFFYSLQLGFEFSFQ